MIRRAYLAALPLLLGGAMAEAQVAPSDASYSCIVEFAAGIRYNERTKKMGGCKVQAAHQVRHADETSAFDYAEGF